MDRLEILKKAKEKVDALVAEKLRAEQDDSADEKATEMAVEMQKHDALVSAIEANYISPEEMARAFEEAVSKIVVNVPEIKVPLIQIPDIKVPEAKVTVSIPEIKLPTINVPEPKVTVNVPELKIPPFPEIKMPESMEIHGEVGLFGYGFNNPLPVQLRDAEGNPVSFGEGGGMVAGGGGRYVKITNDADNPVPITGNITSVPGATYYASDAIGSVNVVQSIPLDVTVIGATGTIGVVTLNPDGNPVYGGSSSGLTDAELRASSIDVQQASGASWSTTVLSMPAVVVTSITNSSASSLVDSGGVQYSGSNPVPVTTVPSAITATTVDATASGDNTIVAITNSPRLYYISLSANGANTADVTAIVKIGASSKYKVSLKAGSIWARHIGAGDRYITGSAGDDIIVNLSAVQTVHVSVEYADI
jgi:hypothetical protein